MSENLTIEELLYLYLVTAGLLTSQTESIKYDTVNALASRGLIDPNTMEPSDAGITLLFSLLNEEETQVPQYTRDFESF
jgi:hypothetical protein